MDYKTLFFLLVFTAFSFNASRSETVSFEEFAGASDDVQRTILANAFRERISHAQNLYYRNAIEHEGRKNDNGREGEILGKGNLRVFSHWQLGMDYKIRREAYLNDPNAPPQVSNNYWDAREGVLRGTFRSEDMPGRVFGRIDTQYNSVLGFNDCFAFLLVGGGSEADGRAPDLYLFPHLIENESGWVIACLSEEGKIQLSFEFEPKGAFWEGDSTGKRTLVLAPDKSFMPVMGLMRRTTKLDDGELFWKEESFYVEESQLVAHVWMPTKLKYVARQSSPEILTDFDIKRSNISEISHGNVTRADVTLTFSEGTEVVDVINGISYKTDARGEPILSTIVPLYDLDPSHANMQLPEPPDRTINWVLIVIGIVLIILGLYIYFRKRYAS